MLSKIKNKLKTTTTKIIISLMLLLAIVLGISMQKNSKDSNASYPLSLERVFYSYTEMAQMDPPYVVKVVIYPHPDRLYTESYVEYYLDDVLIKKDMIN